MKASTESWGDDPTDALLFEYLEGDLSEEHAKQLEEKLSSDPGLQMKLEHWKEAFVEQDFYNTELLEESLLQPPVKVVHISVSAAVFIVALLTSVFSSLPLAPAKERVMPSPPMEIPAPVITAGKKEMVREAQKPAMKEKLLPQVSSHNSTAEETVQTRVLPEKVSEEALLKPKMLPLTVTLPTSGLYALETKINRIGFKKTPVARIITRKQQRKIERMKEKARQERAANQFLKGQVPYVVPLNTNNF